MSSDSEDDDSDNLPPAGSKRARLDRPTYNGRMGTAFSVGSPVAEWLLRRHQTACRHPAARLFTTHICQNSLDNYLSTKPSLTGHSMRRRRVTAVEACLTCTMHFHDEGIVKRSLDLLFLCPACVNELVTLTAANSEALYKLVLGGFRTPTAGHVFMDTFEFALRNAPREGCLPCSHGGLVDFPCVDLGLCRCIMRPLYVAIFYSNVRMVSVLLRYGADVRAEDTCRCEEPHHVHPLVRVYNALACGNNGIPARLARHRPHSEDFVRCHQLAVLVMPTHDAELREACYAFSRTVMPGHELEKLVVEKSTLQHKCRLTVRAALARSRAMPSGVEQLPLPKRLQDYILYKGKLASL
ncbi:hypothetical protein HPB48_010429 [Haemaphysalis longicornis]|uniref:SOCS box domain-containing protein n=1 Tax=Haemaphysalis longicornis TaxID=44386 RepID=A0A9J6H468_HAELO|nr:hypothetical protein HPB48_010429 [Haemaphysalis longicornis]